MCAESCGYADVPHCDDATAYEVLSSRRTSKTLKEGDNYVPNERPTHGFSGLLYADGSSAASGDSGGVHRTLPPARRSGGPGVRPSGSPLYLPESAGSDARVCRGYASGSPGRHDEKPGPSLGARRLWRRGDGAVALLELKR